MSQIIYRDPPWQVCTCAQGQYYYNESTTESTWTCPPELASWQASQAQQPQASQQPPASTPQVGAPAADTQATQSPSTQPVYGQQPMPAGAPMYPGFPAPPAGFGMYGAPPAYGTPAYGAQAYGAPAGYGAAAYAGYYGMPGYGLPAYGAPGYAMPGFGAPVPGSLGAPAAGGLSGESEDRARPAGSFGRECFDCGELGHQSRDCPHKGKPGYKEMCGDFRRGLCNRGEACRYSHTIRGR